MIKKNKYILIIICLLAATFAVAHFAVAATVDPGLNYAAGTGLSAANDPRVIAANIIRIALGFLGIVAVGLIIYAGWLYMTAAGEADKVEKAKKILIGAVIGLLICLASFAIASYILGRLTEATNGNNNNYDDGTVCNPSCGDGQHCCARVCVPSATSCGGGGPDAFAISATIPRDQQTDVVRNVVVKVYFNRAIADTVSQDILNNNFKIEKIATVDAVTKVENKLDPDQPQKVDGAINITADRREINFKANADCDNEQKTHSCLDEWSKYKVTINGGASGLNGAGGLFSINDKPLSVSGNAGSIYQFVFSTNNLIDTSGPTAGIAARQICQDDGSLALMPNANLVDGWANDDVGVSDIRFCSQKQGEAENCFADSVKTGRLDQTNLRHSYKYDTSLYPIGADYIFRVKASDAADQFGQAEFPAKIRPGHCCNGTKDAGETETDCGISAGCGACDGAACANDISVPGTCNDNLCASQTCRPVNSAAKCSAAGYAAGTAECCLCQRPPVITSISPAGGFCKNEPDKACLKDSDCASGDSCDTEIPNGKAGNFFTIYGRNFGAGATPGTVYASSTTGWVKAELANNAAAGGNDKCKNVWSDNQITAIVPGGAETGAIKVENSGGLNTTSDKNGVLDFKINNIDRPGICQLAPDSGKQDKIIDYYGVKLSGANPYFGNINNNVAGVRPSFNDNKTGTAAVPNITTGQTSSFVMKDKAVSNYLDFTKDEELYKGPFITSFDPKEGVAGQYVTINGNGFGTTTGAVFFDDVSSGRRRPASFEFPEKCKKSIWSDKQVIVKVPNGLTNGNYKITMKIGNWPAIDTLSIRPAVVFKFDSSLPLKPGLCLIDPLTGNINTQVSLYGEYFGTADDNSKVRFQANKDQRKPFEYWAKDDDKKITGVQADKIITKVPDQAVTGPVRVVQTKAVITAAGRGVSQLISNGITFKVGVCKTNDDCGSGSLCCSAGTPYSGQCKIGTDEQAVCFPEIKSCVYEWNFSTAGGGTCNNNLAGSCSPNNNKCLDPTKPVCDPATCLCKEAIESCSGYGSSLASCYGQICPNSPGQCSTSQAKSVDTGVKCGFDECNNLPKCQDADGNKLCSYIGNNTNKSIENTCKKNSVECSTPQTVNEAKIIEDKDVTAQCGLIDGGAAWYYASRKTCADGWTKNVAKDKCIRQNYNGQNCEICDTGFICQKDGASGVCVTDKICPTGSSCDQTKQECVKTQAASCSCCCDKTQNTASGSNPGCCAGLKCGDSCGAGGNLGLCTGCTVKDANGNVNQAASNDSCNCSGTSGKFCSTSGAGGLGVCQDCASLSGLSGAQGCSQQGVGFCCVDATKNNVCRGGTDITHVAYDNNNYCAYYECNDGNNGCNTNNPVASSTAAIYLDTTRCDAACGQCEIKDDSCTVMTTDANGKNVVNQAASNDNCCPGTSGKYCNSAANNGAGVCESCSKLEDGASCSSAGAGACCVDATKSDACRGVSVGGDIVKEAVTRESYSENFEKDGELAGWKPEGCEANYSVADGHLIYHAKTDSPCPFNIKYSYDFFAGASYKITIKDRTNLDGYKYIAKLSDGAASTTREAEIPKYGIVDQEYVFDFNDLARDFNQLEFFETDPTGKVINMSNSVDNPINNNNVDYIKITEKTSYAFCAYYSCGTGTAYDKCQGAQKTGTYRTKDCGNNCVKKPSFGQTCFKVSTPTTNQTCDENICSDFSCLNENGDGPTPPNSCGTCCCDPNAEDSAGKPVNQCASLNSSKTLKCVKDKGSCSGVNRGLCCGCSADSDCGSPDTTGCGTDTCCDGRPVVVDGTAVPRPDNYPKPYGDNVCRNSLIKATFNRPMSLDTFSGNVIVAADYGADQCPANTTYLTAAYQPNFLAKLKFWLAKLPLINKLFADAARADAITGNFCAIKGTVNGTNNKDSATLEFSPAQILEPDRKYYVIIKGDTDITDAVKQGVLSASGIGLNPVVANEKTFNGVTYQGKIWSFTTLSEQSKNNGICEVSKVKIDPYSYLFQTNKNDLSDDDPKADTFNKINDSDKVFEATAMNAQGQALAPVDEYKWNWIWSTDNNKIAIAKPVGGETKYFGKELIIANSNISEGETYVKAKAEIVKSPIASTPPGKLITGTAYVKVFVCSNPWPVVKSDGTWEPWRDFGLKCSAADGNCDGPFDTENSSCGTNGHCQYNNCTTQSAYCDNTNFELYYCRDAGGPGTADDLPAIQNDSAVIRGRSNNLKCDDGAGSCEGKNQGDACGNVGGKCQIDILKEFYFFREGKPTASGGLSVSALPQGGGVEVSWNAVTSDPPDPPVAGYKIYYGTTSGNYTDSVDAGNATSKEISGLTNGKTYYFALTSYNAQKAESGYSEPESVTPRDITGPALAPALFAATPKNKQADLEWANNYSEPVSFRVFYKATDTCDDKVNFGSSIPATGNKVTVSNLANGIKYCFGAVAYDSSGNPSATSTVSATPFSPAANLSLVGIGDQSVKLSWDSAVGAAKYKIYYNQGGDVFTNFVATSTPGTTAKPQVVSGLTNGTTYYFAVKSINADNMENADYSNKVSAVPKQ